MLVLCVYSVLEIRWPATKAIFSARSACTPISVMFYPELYQTCGFDCIPYLVTQMQDIKRQKARLENLKQETEEERQRAREAARERVLLEFEKGQLGLANQSVISTSGTESKDSGKFCSRAGCVSAHIRSSPWYEAQV